MRLLKELFDVTNATERLQVASKYPGVNVLN